MYNLEIVDNNTNLINQNVLKYEYLEDFIKFLDIKDKSLETYKKALKSFARYLASNNINAPKRTDILQYKDYLKTNELKATTIQTYITVVKLFFKWAYTANLYANIAEHIKGAKVTREPKKDNLTSLQVKEILNNIDLTTIKGQRDYNIILLAVSCGLRTKELANAKVEDIKPVSDSMALYVLGKGKDCKDDYVKLPTVVYKSILQYLKNANIKNGYIFTSLSNNTSNQLTTRSLSRIIKQAMIASGYNSDRLTAHSLRHTAVTLALLSGEEITKVQEFARHANINTTMIYNHAMNKAKNTCSNSIINQII